MKPEPTFKFHRIDKEKGVDIWEDVEPELWQWETICQYGTILKQFDTNTPLPQFGENVFLYRQSKDIDQSRLQLFKAVSPRLNQFHIIIWNPQRFKLVVKYIRASLVMKILRSRKTKEIEYTQRKEYSAFVYGYENKVGGVAIKTFNVIMPNNEVVTTDDLDNIQLDATPLEEWID